MVSSKTDSDINQRIFTIPNIISFFRLLLIPCFVYSYMILNSPAAAAWILLLSGLSDICDGFIARKFNMVSDLGKMLDPIADKLTQFFMMLCLFVRFPAMIIPILLLAFKEFSTGVFSLIVIRRTGIVMSADWHGKITTVLLYAMMFLHLIWSNIPSAVSNLLIAVSTIMMITSYILYIIRNMRAMSALKNQC